MTLDQVELAKEIKNTIEILTRRISLMAGILSCKNWSSESTVVTFTCSEHRQRKIGIPMPRDTLSYVINQRKLKAEAKIRRLQAELERI